MAFYRIQVNALHCLSQQQMIDYQCDWSTTEYSAVHTNVADIGRLCILSLLKYWTYRIDALVALVTALQLGPPFTNMV